MGRRRGFAALNDDPKQQEAKRLQVSREAHKATLRQLYETALQHIQQQQLGEARSLLEKLLQDDAIQPEAAKEDPFISRLRYLSLKHQGTLLGDTPAALACLQEAAALDREDASLWASLSRTAGRIGYLGLAVSYARQALELCPGDVVVWEWLVYLLAAQGQWEAAGVALKGLAVHEPSHPWLELQRGSAVNSKRALDAVVPPDTYAGLQQAAKRRRMLGAGSSHAQALASQQQQDSQQEDEANPPAVAADKAAAAAAHAAGGADGGHMAGDHAATSWQELVISSAAAVEAPTGPSSSLPDPLQLKVKDLQQLAEQVVKLLQKCATGTAAAAAATGAVVTMGAKPGPSKQQPTFASMVTVVVEELQAVQQQQQDMDVDAGPSSPAGEQLRAPGSAADAAAAAGDEPCTPAGAKAGGAGGAGAEPDTDPDKQQPQEPQETPTQGRVGLRRRGGEEAAAGGAGMAAGRLKGQAAAVRAAQEQVKQLALLFPGLSVAVVSTTGSEPVDQAATEQQPPPVQGGAAAAAAAAAGDDDPGAAATGMTQQQQQSLSRIHQQCLPLTQLAQVVVQRLLELAGQQPLPPPLSTALLQLAPLAEVDLLTDDQLLLLAEAHLEALLSGRAASVKVVPDPNSVAGAKGSTTTATPGTDPQSPPGPAASSKEGPGAGPAKQAGRGTAAAGAGPGSGQGRRTKGAEATAACLAKCEGLLVALQARYLKADIKRQLERGVLSSMPITAAAAAAAQRSEDTLSDVQLQQLQKRLLWQAAEARAVPVKAFQAAVTAAAAAGQLFPDIVPGAWKIAVQQQQQQPGCEAGSDSSSSTQPEWGGFSWQPLYTDPSAVEAPLRPDTPQGLGDSRQQEQQQQQEQHQLLLQRVRALWVQVLLDDHRGRLQEEGAGLSMLLTQIQQLQQDLSPLDRTQSAADAARDSAHGMVTAQGAMEQQQGQGLGPGAMPPGAAVSWQDGQVLVKLWQVPSGSPISLAAVQDKLERMTVRRQLQQALEALQGAQQANVGSVGRAQLAQEAVQLVQPLCEAAAGPKLSQDQLKAAHIIADAAALAVPALRHQQRMQQHQQQQQQATGVDGNPAAEPAAGPDRVVQLEALALQGQLLLLQHELYLQHMDPFVCPAEPTPLQREGSTQLAPQQQQQEQVPAVGLHPGSGSAAGALPGIKVALRMFSKPGRSSSSSSATSGASGSYSSAAVARLARAAQQLLQQQPGAERLLHQVQAGLLNLLLVACTHCSEKAGAATAAAAAAAAAAASDGPVGRGARVAGGRAGPGAAAKAKAAAAHLSVSLVKWQEVMEEAAVALPVLWQISHPALGSSDGPGSSSSSSSGGSSTCWQDVLQLLGRLVYIVGSCSSSASQVQAPLLLARDWLHKLLEQQWAPPLPPPAVVASAGSQEGRAAAAAEAAAAAQGAAAGLTAAAGEAAGHQAAAAAHAQDASAPAAAAATGPAGGVAGPPAAAGICLDVALAQVLFLLYGFDISWRCEEFSSPPSSSSSSREQQEVELDHLDLDWEKEKGEKVLRELWGYLHGFSKQRIDALAAAGRDSYEEACVQLLGRQAAAGATQQEQQQQEGLAGASSQQQDPAQQQQQDGFSPEQAGPAHPHMFEQEAAYWRSTHELLQLLVDHLPTPPQEVLEEGLSRLQQVLEGEEVADVELLQGAGNLQDLLNRAWDSWALDSSKDPDHALHSTLYYSYLISHPSGDEEETKGDAATPGAAAAGGGNDHAPDMLSSEWLGALEESTSYTCWDLVYNHQRWRSWDFLGQEYEQALQLLLQQAADRLPPGIWATSHQATLNAVCRRLWRSYLAVACLSQQPGACRDSGDVAYAREVHERLGKSCWERVACCLPLWDAGRGVRQEKGAVAALCRSALHQYMLAEQHSTAPDEEWEYALLRGKLQLRLQPSGSTSNNHSMVMPGSDAGLTDPLPSNTTHSSSSSSGEALACFAQAVQRSGAGGGGVLLRPYVELHVLRLQLMIAAVTADELQLVAHHCFNQNMGAAAQQALAAAAAEAAAGRADGPEPPHAAAAAGVPIWHHATEQLAVRAGGKGSGRGGSCTYAELSKPHQYLATAWLLLWDDCCRALAHGQQQWLAATKEQLHPASYALAKAWMLLGHPQKAAAELRPLFQPEAAASDGAGTSSSHDGSSSSRFCIAMCQLEDAAWPEEEEALDGNKPSSSTDAPAAAAGDAAAAGSLGGTPPQFGGWGGEEEAREFYSALRQCLLLYLQACAAVADGDTLHQAWSWLLPSQGGEGMPRPAAKDKQSKRSKGSDSTNSYYMQTRDLGQLAAGLHICLLLQQLVPVLLEVQATGQQRANAARVQRQQQEQHLRQQHLAQLQEEQQWQQQQVLQEGKQLAALMKKECDAVEHIRNIQQDRLKERIRLQQDASQQHAAASGVPFTIQQHTVQVQLAAAECQQIQANYDNSMKQLDQKRQMQEAMLRQKYRLVGAGPSVLAQAAAARAAAAAGGGLSEQQPASGSSSIGKPLWRDCSAVAHHVLLASRSSGNLSATNTVPNGAGDNQAYQQQQQQQLGGVQLEQALRCLFQLCVLSSWWPSSEANDQGPSLGTGMTAAMALLQQLEGSSSRTSRSSGSQEALRVNPPAPPPAAAAGGGGGPAAAAAGGVAAQGAGPPAAAAAAAAVGPAAAGLTWRMLAADVSETLAFFAECYVCLLQLQQQHRQQQGEEQQDEVQQQQQQQQAASGAASTDLRAVLGMLRRYLPKHHRTTLKTQAGLKTVARGLVNLVLDQQQWELDQLQQQLTGLAELEPLQEVHPEDEQQQQQEQEGEEMEVEVEEQAGAAGAPVSAQDGSNGATQDGGPQEDREVSGKEAVAADREADDMEEDGDKEQDGPAATTQQAAAADVPLAMGRAKRAAAAAAASVVAAATGAAASAATAAAAAAAAAGLVDVVVPSERKQAIQQVLTVLQHYRALLKMQPHSLHPSTRTAHERMKHMIQQLADLAARAAGVPVAALAVPGLPGATTQVVDVLVSRLKQLEQGKALQQMVEAGAGGGAATAQRLGSASAAANGSPGAAGGVGGGQGASAALTPSRAGSISLVPPANGHQPAPAGGSQQAALRHQQQQQQQQALHQHMQPQALHQQQQHQQLMAAMAHHAALAPRGVWGSSNGAPGQQGLHMPLAHPAAFNHLQQQPQPWRIGRQGTGPSQHPAPLPGVPMVRPGLPWLGPRGPLSPQQLELVAAHVAAGLYTRPAPAAAAAAGGGLGVQHQQMLPPGGSHMQVSAHAASTQHVSGVQARGTGPSAAAAAVAGPNVVKRVGAVKRPTPAEAAAAAAAQMLGEGVQQEQQDPSQ